MPTARAEKSLAAHGPDHPHIAYADANLGEVLAAHGEAPYLSLIHISEPTRPY